MEVKMVSTLYQIKKENIEKFKSLFQYSTLRIEGALTVSKHLFNFTNERSILGYRSSIEILLNQDFN